MGRQRARERARQALTQAIAQAGRAGCSRLPSLSSLASAAGVSSRTMWSVSHEYVAAGLVGSRRGSGLSVRCSASTGASGTARDTPAAAADRQFAWERTRDAIRRAVHDGTCGTSSRIPSVKELRRRFGVSFVTAKKALESLRTEGLLERVGSGFRVCGYGSTRRGQRVALVTRVPMEGIEGRLPPRFHENLILFESACAALELGVSHVRLSYLEQDLVVDSDRDGALSHATPVLGFVVWPVTMSSDLEPAWRMIVDTGKPAAVMASDTEQTAFVSHHHGRSTAVVRTARNYEAGVAVAHHLLERGHTNVAFLSPVENGDWVAPRLAGMRSVFAAAGFPSAVQGFFAVSDPKGLWQTSREGTGPLYDAITGLADLVERNAVQEDPAQMGAVWHELSLRYPGVIDSAGLYRAVVPLCKQALDRGGFTAYVGANDETALRCLTFLRSRGYSPRELSVVGFDNTVEASQEELTSYDFGVPAAIHRSLDFVLRPLSHKRTLSGVHETQVKGALVERGSVRRPNTERPAGPTIRD